MKSQPKIKKSKSVKYLRNKADRVLQEWGRRTYKKCAICHKHNTVLHHIFHKSSSNNLRYDERNVIPLCQGHHFLVHNGDVFTNKEVFNWLGDNYDVLLKEKNKYVKTNAQFYLDAIIKYGNDKNTTTQSRA